MAIAKPVLLIILGATALAFAIYWASMLRRRRQWVMPTPFQMLVGFITDFLDTLGIGSFAVTTSLYRPFKTVRDELIPGKLNVGHTLPTIAQAFVFIAVVEVDVLTLWLLIAASVAGAWWGARLVVNLSKRAVQLGMGCALLVAATFLLMKLMNHEVKDGEAIGLMGKDLFIAMAFNFVFGALMTIGVGAYAPIMVLISLMGMNAKTAFPVMMGSCAFLMPVASRQFIKSDRYDARAALGLTLLGVPAVCVAAPLVDRMPLDMLKTLVLLVVVYTAITMLASAFRNQPDKA